MPTVIRAQELGRSVNSAPFNFDDMAQQAQQKLEQVQARASQLVEQAQQQAAAIREKSAAEGKQAALAEIDRFVEERIAKEIGSALPAIHATVDQIEQSKQTFLADWERNVVQLACAIAARVIRREVQHAPEITLELIREALQLATGSPQVRVALNPKDQSALSGQLQPLLAELNRLGTAEIVAEETVEPGGCRIETQYGAIDQQIAAQLERIEQELTAG